MGRTKNPYKTRIINDCKRIAQEEGLDFYKTRTLVTRILCKFYRHINDATIITDEEIRQTAKEI